MRLATIPGYVLPLLSLVACDSGGPAATPTDATPTDATVADTASTSPAEADASAPDASAPDASAPDPSAPTLAYPDGPFGTNYLDITRDLEFFDPWTGALPRLADYYQHPDIKVLLVSSAAGWCTACMYEAWDLVEVYDKYQGRGLEVLYTIYEDRDSKPIFQDGASDDEITADMAFFRAWEMNLGKYIGLPIREANYPVLADRDFVLEDYYNEGATPLTLIVRTSDMRILYRQVGYAAGTIEQLIRGHIADP